MGRVLRASPKAQAVGARADRAPGESWPPQPFSDRAGRTILALSIRRRDFMRNRMWVNALPNSRGRAMNLVLKLLRRLTCRHDYRYSMSKPGTLVCRRCGSRKHD